ncbi:MAG: virulence RhuM family protein, partial [Anaeroplasmataceae bacterium]|nr:virulence RhuM family protein [Anaeroplasmataceae bacterium]
MLNNKNNYDLIKFEDGEFSLDVNVSPQEDTVWLTQEQISILYQKAKSTINEHIKKILESELDAQDVSRKFGKNELSSIKTKPIIFYSLDMVLAVGYRVNSKRGILFRKWATSILKQYMLNGYSINEKHCLECQENLVSLNNKVNTLLEHDIQH